MAKISIYFSPKALNSSDVDIKNKLQEALFRHDLILKSPLSIDELKNELIDDISYGVEVIVSVGGDGTANLIANELILAQAENIKLLVIPKGTANDFANELNVTTSVKKIIQMIQYNSCKKVDIVKINNKIMLTNGGIGLPHHVSQLVNKKRVDSPFYQMMMKTLKSNIYSIELIKVLAMDEFPVHEISIQSQEFNGELKTSILLINNQPCFGKNFKIAPFTKNNDGKVNVTIFRHTDRQELIGDILRIRAGRPVKYKNLIETFETSCLEINSLNNQPIHFFGDGEDLECSTRLVIEVQPSAITTFYYNKSQNYFSSYDLDVVSPV